MLVYIALVFMCPYFGSSGSIIFSGSPITINTMFDISDTFQSLHSFLLPIIQILLEQSL